MTLNLSIEEKEKLMKTMGEKHPIFATVNRMIDSLPCGMKGLLQIQETIDELKNFEGSDEEFYTLLRNKRTAFRKSNGLEDFTEDEFEKFNEIAKFVKKMSSE
jgi:hypothetical protein